MVDRYSLSDEGSSDSDSSCSSSTIPSLFSEWSNQRDSGLAAALATDSLQQADQTEVSAQASSVGAKVSAWAGRRSIIRAVTWSTGARNRLFGRSNTQNKIDEIPEGPARSSSIASSNAPVTQQDSVRSGSITSAQASSSFESQQVPGRSGSIERSSIGSFTKKSKKRTLKSSSTTSLEDHK
jgi:hypothetical protein